MKRVIVVGGGVIGACCAYYLARAGHKVAILDRGPFGQGCSHANCGYVCPSHVLPLAVPGAVRATLKTLFARNSPLKVRPATALANLGWFLGFARKCNTADMLAAGHAMQALLNSSRALFAELIETEQLECEWETKGLLFVFRSRQAFDHYGSTDDLLREQFHMGARRLDADELLLQEPALAPGNAGGYLYEGDAHLRPDRLMSELLRTLKNRDVEVIERREVAGFLGENGIARAVRLGSPAGETPYSLEADHFIVATGAWTPHLNRALGCRVPIQPGKGYSITMPRPTVCPAHPLILEEHRVAVTPFQTGYRLGSTMEFAGYDQSLDPSRLSLLTDAAKLYLREPLAEPVQETWWGWRPMTYDGLPIIDRSPAWSNVFIAAGHNMLGLSMATATGKLVSEMLDETKTHIDPGPYSIRRFG